MYSEDLQLFKKWQLFYADTKKWPVIIQFFFNVIDKLKWPVLQKKVKAFTVSVLKIFILKVCCFG